MSEHGPTGLPAACPAHDPYFDGTCDACWVEFWQQVAAPGEYYCPVCTVPHRPAAPATFACACEQLGVRLDDLLVAVLDSLPAAVRRLPPVGRARERWNARRDTMRRYMQQGQ